MIELKINKNRYRIPDEKIIAAYAGTHANRFALNMKEWFRRNKVSYHDSFIYAMKRGMKSIRRQIKELPKKMTMKQLIKKAPTYWEF